VVELTAELGDVLTTPLLPGCARVVPQAHLVCRRRLGEGVCQSHLDERLSGDAEAPALLIDVAQQVHREVHVHALHRAASAHERQPSTAAAVLVFATCLTAPPRRCEIRILWSKPGPHRRAGTRHAAPEPRLPWPLDRD
jgi:hypothetical protein